MNNITVLGKDEKLIVSGGYTKWSTVTTPIEKRSQQSSIMFWSLLGVSFLMAPLVTTATLTIYHFCVKKRR